MKNIIKQSFQRITAFIFLIFLVFLGIQSNTIKAEAAAYIGGEKKLTIGYGTMGSDLEYSTYYSWYPYSFEIYRPVKGAAYSFVSSNTKVVQVKTSGNKVYLTGKSFGTSTITCKQKLKGKTTILQTKKVTVKPASLTLKNNPLNQDGTVKDVTMQISKGKREIFRIPFIIQQRNFGAKYTYTTNSKNLTITEKFSLITDKKTKSKDLLSSLLVDAKKAGNYTVTVKETFNKKTKTIGSFKMAVDNSKYQNVITMEHGDSLSISHLLDSSGNMGNLTRIIEGDGFNITDSDNVIHADSTIEDHNSYIREISAEKPGIAKINVYTYDKATNKKGNFIESYLIQVTEPTKLEEKALHINQTTLDTYLGSPETTWLSWDVRYTPLRYQTQEDRVTVTSSDESVAAIKKYTDSANIIPTKAGTATITITFGSLSNSCNVTVYPNQEEYLKSKSFINKTKTVKLNSYFNLGNELVYPQAEEYYVEGDGFDLTDKNSILYSTYYPTFKGIDAKKVGTAKLNIFEYDIQKQIKGNLLGSLYIKIEEPMADDIVLSKYKIETYLGVNSSDEANESSYFRWAVFPPTDEVVHFYEDYGLYGNFYGSKDLRKKTLITFSDPSILDLKYSWPDVEAEITDDSNLQIFPKKAGKTTITFQCDNATASCDVIVYANKAEYQNAIENR